MVNKDRTPDWKDTNMALFGSDIEKKVKAAMEPLLPLLPKERPYMPALSREELVRLQMARPSD